MNEDECISLTYKQPKRKQDWWESYLHLQLKGLWCRQCSVCKFAFTQEISSNQSMCNQCLARKVFVHDNASYAEYED